MTLGRRLSLITMNSIVRIHTAATGHIGSNLSEPPVIMEQHDGKATIKYPPARAQQVLWLISSTLPSAWVWQHSK